MIVTTLTMDGKRISQPMWHDIDLAIRSLNGDSCTGIGLETENEFPYMAIGGGKNGYCTLTMFSAPAKLYVLHSGLTIPGQLHMVVDGQRISMDYKELASIEDAIKAAKRFIVDGMPEEGLLWTEG